MKGKASFAMSNSKKNKQPALKPQKNNVSTVNLRVRTADELRANRSSAYQYVI